MKRPVARPAAADARPPRSAARPRAFAPAQGGDLPETIEPIADADAMLVATPPPRRSGWARHGWPGRAGGILVSLALGLAAER